MPSSPVKINVPGNHLMVGLLGQRDELLRLIEAAFADTDIHVRGNEITVEGEDTEAVGRLFEELVILVQRGHALEPAEVVRTIDMVRADERPSEVLTAEVLRGFKGRTVRPKSSGPEALRRRHRREHHHLRHRPGRHRQVLAGGGHRGAGPAGQGGRAHHPHPARRSRRASGSASCPAT